MSSVHVKARLPADYELDVLLEEAARFFAKDMAELQQSFRGGTCTATPTDQEDEILVCFEIIPNTRTIPLPGGRSKHHTPTASMDHLIRFRRLAEKVVGDVFLPALSPV